MRNLITNNPAALQLLMTDDLYLLKEENIPSEISEPKLALKQVLGNPIAANRSIPEIKELKDFAYLGENNKYFLIIVDDKTHKDLNAAHKEMLLKIVQAKGLELRDLAILNLDRHKGATFNNLKEFFVCNKIVLFGISPQQIGISTISLNKPEKYQNVKILVTYSLEEMKNEVDKKREFWTVMKPF